MAGLNFQTQTIINSNLDPNSGKEAVLFKAGDEVLDIKRDFHFFKDKEGYGKVCAVRKRAGYEAKLCKATIDFDEVVNALVWEEDEKKVYCRLDLYLGVEGNSEFIFGIQSPNAVQKYIPFWVEFTVKKDATGADVAKAVEKAIKSNHVFQCDKDLIDVTVEDAVMTLEGAKEYLRFNKMEISQFSMFADYADVVAALDPMDEDAKVIVLEERGENSFGTYSQIVKDLRLLTGANYQPYHVRQVETPIIGAIYDQYIIEYCGPAVNDGMQFVGQRGDTHTLHVFWVRHDDALIAEWEEALDAIGGVTEDADEFLADYKAKGESSEEETPVEP